MDQVDPIVLNYKDSHRQQHSRVVIGIFSEAEDLVNLVHGVFLRFPGDGMCLLFFYEGRDCSWL